MGKWRRLLDSIGFPALLVIWVVSGVVLICQWKGMLPWFDRWAEALFVLIVFIPPVLLGMYVVSEILKLVLSRMKT
jgi:hypothetical protein